MPSSLGLTMIALRPANRPESTRTTLPCFIILPIFLAAEQFNVVTPQENLKEKEDDSVNYENIGIYYVIIRNGSGFWCSTDKLCDQIW